jgi:hypothetical protein
MADRAARDDSLEIGSMFTSTVFALVLAVSAQVAASAPSPDEVLCGEAMSVYLPEPQRFTAANIELLNFQYMSPDDRCGRNIGPEELSRLHAGIKPIAAATLSSSRSSFEVMVRYTLSPTDPTTFDMQVSEGADTETERLGAFYEQAKMLNDFHSSSGTVYVVFHYAVSPSTLGGAPSGHE